MAAKAALTKILSQPSPVDAGSMAAAALSCARDHHMGVSALCKLRSELFGGDGLPDAPSVEAAIRGLVEAQLLCRQAINDSAVDQNEAHPLVSDQTDNCSEECSSRSTIVPPPANQDGEVHQPDHDQSGVSLSGRTTVVPSPGCSVDLEPAPTPTPSGSQSTSAPPTAAQIDSPSSLGSPTSSLGSPAQPPEPTAPGSAVAPSSEPIASGSAVALSTSRDFATQASLLPTSEDFAKLLAGFKQLQRAFAEFTQESADREVRYTRKIAALTGQVSDLKADLQAARVEAKAMEQRLVKKISDMRDEAKAADQRLDKKVSDMSSSVDCLSASANCKSSPPDDLPFSAAASVTILPESRRAINLGDRATHQQVPANDRQRDQRDQRHADERQLQRDRAPTNQPDPAPAENNAWPNLPSPHASAPRSVWAAAPPEDNWQVQRSRSSRSASSLRGAASSSSSSSGLKGAAPVKRAVFYLGGIDPSCTAADISAYCQSQGVRVASCRLLPSKRFGTLGARLAVPAADAALRGLTREGFWPELMSIREWKFPDSTD